MVILKNLLNQRWLEIMDNSNVTGIPKDESQLLIMGYYFGLCACVCGGIFDIPERCSFG